MKTWNKFKKWMGDTLSFSYLKKLIDSDTNDDLKDAMAVFFSVIAGGIAIYAAIVGDNATRLTILFYLIGFICTLTGLKTVKEMQHKSSDNSKEKAIEVVKGGGIG